MMSTCRSTLLFFFTTQTHRHSGDGSDEGVDEDWRRLAVVLWSWVRLGVGFVKTEEALDVHGERVRVLKVVRQQNRPCHDDQLEIKHIGSSFRVGSTEECRFWERKESQKKEKWKIVSRIKKKRIKKRRDFSFSQQNDGCFRNV